MKLIIPIVLSWMFAVGANAAMVRVVAVQDGRTLVVERNGAREVIRLAGLDVHDEFRATELLRWTVGTSWILAEVQEGGGYFVWRSPDALFINRELVLRGYARATQYGIEPEPNLHVTYLGEVNPAGGAPAVSAAPPRTGSDTRLRSSAPPSRRTRSGRVRPDPRNSASRSRKP